jgi:hypothetical protein
MHERNAPFAKVLNFKGKAQQQGKGGKKPVLSIAQGSESEKGNI